MKLITSFYSAILLLFVGCSSAATTQLPSDSQGHVATLKLYSPTSHDSRIAITPDIESGVWSVNWEDDDKVGVCTEGSVDRFTVAVNGDSSADFSGSTVASSTARIVYPYDAEALSGSIYSLDLSEQSCDMDDAYDVLGDRAPMVSSELVDMSVAEPSAYMKHIGAALEVQMKFTDLDSGVEYRIKELTINDMPVMGQFSIGGEMSRDDFLTTTQGDLSVAVVSSPQLAEGEVYTVLCAVLPFAVEPDESVDFTVALEKSVGGSVSTIYRNYSCVNNSDSTLDFERGYHHSIRKECSLALPMEVATLTIDERVLTNTSYPDDPITLSVGDNEFTTMSVMKRSYSGVPHLQFQSKAGYIYNSTPLEGMSQITVDFNSEKGSGFTLYVGSEEHPLATAVEATTVADTTLLYDIPDASTYFTLCNESSAAAYTHAITIKYLTEAEEPDGSTGGGSTDQGNEGGSDPSIYDVVEATPYYTNDAPRWGEIPAHVASDNYIYVSHFAEIGGASVRNFSLCFDTENRAAAWVAYPYHECYNGDVERTNDWGFDPLISEELQADLDSSYAAYNGVDYDRGHQMASGDRLATELLNEQTFFYSNMTPQNSSLNRGKWNSFEEDVRAQSCADTLYIVTGADYSQLIGTTTDASGNACPIPHAFFKVLLRTKAGDSGKSVDECSANELQAIGYWVENTTHDVFPAPVSVSYIEEKTGFDFFPTVPDSVKERVDISLWNEL